MSQSSRNFLILWKTESGKPCQVGILSSGSSACTCVSGGWMDGGLQTPRAMLQTGRLSLPLQGSTIPKLCSLCTAVSPKFGRKKGPQGRSEGMKKNKMVSHVDMQMRTERHVRVHRKGCKSAKVLERSCKAARPRVAFLLWSSGMPCVALPPRIVFSREAPEFQIRCVCKI